MPHALRDITQYTGTPDVAYLQLKISAAGEMKSAIKRLLDGWAELCPCAPPDDPRAEALKSAMEEFLNVS